MTAKKKAPATAATKGDIAALRAEIARLEAAGSEAAPVKLVKSGYAVVGSTPASDAVESLVKSGSSVKEACEALGYKYVEHEIAEGSQGPIVVIDSSVDDEEE